MGSMEKVSGNWGTGLATVPLNVGKLMDGRINGLNCHQDGQGENLDDTVEIKRNNNCSGSGVFSNFGDSSLSMIGGPDTERVQFLLNKVS